MVEDFKVFAEFYQHVTPKYPEHRGVVAVDPAVLAREKAA
jgi:hypothetical protein